MAKFSAESLSDIEYDFRGFKDRNRESINDFGTIPEPTREAVNDAMQKMTTAFDGLGIKGVESTPEGVASAMSNVKDENVFEKIQTELLDTMAELCSGTPSRDSLERLPYRAFMGFMGYLFGEVMSPEVSKPDTNSTRGLLRSV